MYHEIQFTFKCFLKVKSKIHNFIYTKKEEERKEKDEEKEKEEINN